MNSGPTSERVHDAIRDRILTRAFHPGQRLDPAVLAQSVSSSITPVRDALHLLAGAGLVVTGTGEGFHVPHIDEPALKDLYRWNLEVLMLATRAWPRACPGAWDDDDRADADRPLDPPLAVAALAIAIARRSPNAEHLRMIRSLNDRLHPLRLAEQMVLEPDDGELEPLAAALADHDDPQLRRHLAAYHRLRERKAAEIVRAHYRR